MRDSFDDEKTLVDTVPQDHVAYLIGEVASFRTGMDALTRSIAGLAKVVEASTNASLEALQELRKVQPLVNEHASRLDALESKCLRQHANGRQCNTD